MRLPSSFLAMLVSGLLLSGPLAAVAGATEGGSASSDSTASPMTFGEALNALRAQSGLGPLGEDRILQAAAQARAEEMARTGDASHTGPDGSTVVDRARRAGCRGRGYFAENIAWGQDSVGDTFAGWSASAGHRANMLGPNYGVYGLGQAGGMWVLMFADAC